MTSIKCALVVGGGSIGRRHLSIMRQLMPDIKLILCSRSGQKNEHANITCTRLLDAIAHRPQIAIVASITERHITDSLVLAEQGIHLLIEKPISHSMEGLERLLMLIEEKKITVFVGYNLRYLDVLQKMKQVIDAKPEIGQVMSIECECSSYLPHWRPGQDYKQSNSVRYQGGGVILELSHELDYLQWIFGQLQYGMSQTMRRDQGIQAADYCLALFHTKVLSDRVPVKLTLDFFRQDAVRSLTVIGRLGTIKCDLIRGSIEVYGDAATVLDHTAHKKHEHKWRKLYSTDSNKKDDTYTAQLQDFICRIATSTVGCHEQVNQAKQTLAHCLKLQQ